MLGATGLEIAALVAVAGALLLLWVLSLFLLVLDDLSLGLKVVWFLALTLLAPLAIPVYLFTRRRRRREAQGALAA